MGSFEASAPAVAAPYQALVIQTPQFGQMWQQAATQKKFQQFVHPATNSPQAYEQRVKERLGLHVIQIINNEVISGG